MEFKVGQIFKTKKGKKMEVTEIYKGGSIELKLFVHRDSGNCKSYGWAHNTVWFRQCMMIDGRFGLIEKIKKEGWKLEKKKKISATITK